MFLTKKVSSKIGYVVLTVAVIIFIAIFYIANKAQSLADKYTDQALSGSGKVILQNQ